MEFNVTKNAIQQLKIENNQQKAIRIHATFIGS